MAKSVLCSGGCGKTLKTSIFSDDSFLVDGNYYCYDCMKKLPPYAGKECYQCANYGIDYNSNGFCHANDNAYTDRYKKACEKYIAK